MTGGWFFLSLGCAFLTASVAVLSKIILAKKNEFFVIWAIYAFSLPVLFLVFLFQPRPHLGPGFWKTVAILMPFELIACLMYFRSLKISPLSLVFPFLGLTPVVTIFSSFLILKERLPPNGIFGVILVSLGAYLLNIRSIKDGFFAPFKNLFREKGVLLMIAVAVIYGFTCALGKKAVLLSGPETFPAIYYSIFFAIFTPIFYVKAKLGRDSDAASGYKFGKKDFFRFLALGTLFAGAILFHFKAITLVNVAYMVSVKRLSLVISVAYGALIFKEKSIGYRFLGASVMVCGVVVLSLA